MCCSSWGHKELDTLIHTISVFYCAHFCMKYSLGISNFLGEISSLSHCNVFLYFFALITEEVISFLSLLDILWNSDFKWVCLSFSPLPFAFRLLSAICKSSSDNHFDFLHFFFLGMVCAVSQTSVHSPSGALSIRSDPFRHSLYQI